MAPKKGVQNEASKPYRTASVQQQTYAHDGTHARLGPSEQHHHPNNYLEETLKVLQATQLLLQQNPTQLSSHFCQQGAS